MRALPNRRRTSLCWKKKKRKEKAEHFKACSGREWKRGATAARMNAGLRGNVPNFCFLVCLSNNHTRQTHFNARILFLAVLKTHQPRPDICALFCLTWSHVNLFTSQKPNLWWRSAALNDFWGELSLLCACLECDWLTYWKQLKSLEIYPLLCVYI